jgi:hypothetical protein
MFAVKLRWSADVAADQDVSRCPSESLGLSQETAEALGIGYVAHLPIRIVVEDTATCLPTSVAPIN